MNLAHKNVVFYHKFLFFYHKFEHKNIFSTQICTQNSKFEHTNLDFEHKKRLCVLITRTTEKKQKFKYSARYYRIKNAENRVWLLRPAYV